MTGSSFVERDGALVADFKFVDFADAFAFATRIAMVSESSGHHPRLTVEWGSVEVLLTTHDAGNTITARDRDLAVAIDQLATKAMLR